MTDFGKRLKTLRKSVDITQEQLADALGISYQAVSKWETGSGLPDISLLPGIAEFFGVSTDWLLGIKTDNADEKINAVLEEVFHLKHILTITSCLPSGQSLRCIPLTKIAKMSNGLN